MTVVALDAMGGDFAPRVPVEAAARVLRAGGSGLMLVGDREALEAEWKKRGLPAEALREGEWLCHAPQEVAMDEAPTVVLRDKPDASVRVACREVAQGRAAAVVSAGHTGALMVAGKHEMGTLPGLDRPAVATPLPVRRGFSLLLDTGANADCRPHLLLQFARMGRIYARTVAGIERPRVALLSNGAEPSKGNELVRSAHRLLAEALPDFIGNLEGRDLFKGRAEVIVCDGFTGNLVLKTAEAAGQQMRMLMNEALAASPWTRLGHWLTRGALQEVRRRTDYREVGGSLFLGLQGVALVCHGASNASTLINAVNLARQCAEANLVEALRAEFLRDGHGATATG